MGVSNLEARIKKLENTSQSEFGTPANTIFFPVRKLMLSEEKSHNEDGVVFPVLVATWDKPAGVIFPESIRLIHNGTTVSLAGTATSYRMPGYLIGDTVTVNVTAMYLQGASSTVTAVKTITGDATPPSVPTNLTVTGGFRTLTLRWENPTTEDFSHVEIWESVIGPDVATSERIAQAYGTECVRSNCGVLETRWYWIRALDVNGNFSDFTSVASGTTTAIAMEDVPENTISESMLVDALAQKIDDTDAAIQIVEDVRMGEVNVFRQATAPTTGMITGDLWVNNSGVVYRYEGGAWVSKAGSTVYDLLKTAIAQYVVKTQTASGDGKLKIAGFGLYNDSTTGSEFAVLADRFYVYGQKSDGSSYSNIKVFTVDTTTTPPTVGINGNLIVDGSIVGEKIYAGAKIQLADGGQLIIGDGGVIQIGSGAIYLDSDEGVIRVQDPADLTEGDFAELSTGNLVTYKYLKPQSASINKVPYPMRVLRGVESGVATNGALVTLSNRYPQIPKIMVSPNSIMTYKTGAPGDQRIHFSASDISYNSETGIVTFMPTAILTASGLTGTLTPSPVVGYSAWSLHAGNLVPAGTTKTINLGSIVIPSGPGSYTITGKLFCMLPYYPSGGSSSGYAQNGTCYLYINENNTDYLMGSVPFGQTYINTSSEPINNYIQFTITRSVASTQKTVYLKAVFIVASGIGAKISGSWSAGANAWARFVSCSYNMPGSVLSPDGTLNYIALSD